MPAQVRPTDQAMLDKMDELTAAVEEGGDGGVTTARVEFTSSGRRRRFITTCICWHEELNNGKTKLWLTTGKNTTVDEGYDEVTAAIEAAES